MDDIFLAVVIVKEKLPFLPKTKITCLTFFYLQSVKKTDKCYKVNQKLFFIDFLSNRISTIKFMGRYRRPKTEVTSEGLF